MMGVDFFSLLMEGYCVGLPNGRQVNKSKFSN